jgi:hypothetical protein
MFYCTSRGSSIRSAGRRRRWARPRKGDEFISYRLDDTNRDDGAVAGNTGATPSKVFLSKKRCQAVGPGEIVCRGPRPVLLVFPRWNL